MQLYVLNEKPKVTNAPLVVFAQVYCCLKKKYDK